MHLGHFKPLELEDKAVFDEAFRRDPPLISELTFTNLFMWRGKYLPLWRLWGDCLLIILRPEDGGPFGLFPIGTGDRRRALDALCTELGELGKEVHVCRVDEEKALRYGTPERYAVEPDRNNSDYVYLAEDLIRLSGRKYHRKKNHLNQFLKNCEFEYRTLDAELVECFLELQESWCRMRECVEHPALLSEDFAIREALTRFGHLNYRGAAILVRGKVEAFSLGEALNENTVVIHIEKANPDIPGLYAAINHLFCRNEWSSMRYVNREQDLGVEGIRKAKESYYPDHLVHKYTLRPLRAKGSANAPSET